VSEANPMRT